MPCAVAEMLDAEQADFRGEQLPLHREQRHLIDIARMQLDLDDRLVQDLELDETKIPDGIANSVIIGLGVTQRAQKLWAVGKYPIPFRGDHHRQALHLSLSLPATRHRRS